MDVRCPSRIHGILLQDDLLEIKCSSQSCGAGRGTVVFHYFDVLTWELVETRRYTDPIRERKQ